MTLDDAQKKKVTQWIAEGAKLSDIQKKLDSDLGIRLTYMEVRLLVDDLKLTPKDVERVKPGQSPLTEAAAPAPTGATAANIPAAAAKAADSNAPASGVSVSVDHLARAGAVVSGKVTFSDGNKAEWYLDQAGRLGLVAQQPGYHPPPADVQQFQMALETELSKRGL